MWAFIAMPGPMELLILLALLIACPASVAGVVLLILYLVRQPSSAAGQHLVPCPDCGRRISPQAPACPQCGRPQTPQETGVR